MYIGITERNDWEGETWTRYIPQTESNITFAKRFEDLAKKYGRNEYSIQFDIPKPKDSSSFPITAYMHGHKVIEAEFDANDLPDGPHSMDESKSFEQYVYKMKWTRHPIADAPRKAA